MSTVSAWCTGAHRSYMMPLSHLCVPPPFERSLSSQTLRSSRIRSTDSLEPVFWWACTVRPPTSIDPGFAENSAVTWSWHLADAPSTKSRILCQGPVSGTWYGWPQSPAVWSSWCTMQEVWIAITHRWVSRSLRRWCTSYLELEDRTQSSLSAVIRTSRARECPLLIEDDECLWF